MAVVEIQGLEPLRRRLESLGEMSAGPALRAEAQAIAAAARATLQEGYGEGALARSVEILDESQPDRPRFAIGTRHAAGWSLEHGTRRTRARPWLGPAFLAALPGVNHTLRKMLAGTLKALGKR